MAKRKKQPLNRLNEGARGIVVGATVLGVGASIGIGGSAAGGLSAAASVLPAAGTILGASVVVGQLKKLPQPKRKKR